MIFKASGWQRSNVFSIASANACILHVSIQSWGRLWTVASAFSGDASDSAERRPPRWNLNAAWSSKLMSDDLGLSWFIRFKIDRTVSKNIGKPQLINQPLELQCYTRHVLSLLWSGGFCMLLLCFDFQRIWRPIIENWDSFVNFGSALWSSWLRHVEVKPARPRPRVEKLRSRPRRIQPRRRSGPVNRVFPERVELAGKSPSRAFFWPGSRIWMHHVTFSKSWNHDNYYSLGRILRWGYELCPREGVLSKASCWNWQRQDWQLMGRVIISTWWCFVRCFLACLRDRMVSRCERESKGEGRGFAFAECWITLLQSLVTRV